MGTDRSLAVVETGRSLAVVAPTEVETVILIGSLLQLDHLVLYFRYWYLCSLQVQGVPLALISVMFSVG